MSPAGLVVVAGLAGIVFGYLFIFVDLLRCHQKVATGHMLDFLWGLIFAYLLISPLANKNYIEGVAFITYTMSTYFSFRFAEHQAFRF